MDGASEQSKSCDVGTAVVVTLKNGQVMEGDVLAYHSNEKLLMLQKPMPTGLNTALTMIRTDNIKNLTILGVAQPRSDSPLPTVAASISSDREARSIAAARAEAARVGVNVTEEGQRIFDALAKTLPCEWRGRDILVMAEVLIVPPYDLPACSQVVSNAELFDRLKKVLSAERQKLGIV